MKYVTLLLFLFIVSAAVTISAADQRPQPSNGIAYPSDWQNWATIAVSHRTDNQTLRLILGNETAINAARSGQINPWPDGAIMAKVVWKEMAMEHWQSAAVPGDLVHVEFMLKDAKKYADTYGWGWARWLGMKQEPFNNGPQGCISCHTPVKERDWVFTDPAIFPAIW